jgi:hypothetical protein
MDLIERFGEYAAAFEVAFEKDDWSVVEPFFGEDAVYELVGGPPFEGRIEGCKAVLDYLKGSLDTFDRRFDTRELGLVEGPELRDGAVWVRFRVTYRVQGAPPLVLDGEETARFEGDRIRRLEDRFAEGVSPRTLKWMEEHGAKLKPAPTGTA